MILDEPLNGAAKRSCGSWQAWLAAMATSTFLMSLMTQFHCDVCCDCAEAVVHRELKTCDNDAANHILSKIERSYFTFEASKSRLL